MATTPTPIPANPLPPPLLTDDSTTFNTRAESIYLWLVGDVVPGVNGTATNVYNNALIAEAGAIAAEIAVGAANYKGDYLAGTTYLQGQSVSYLGERYIAKKTNLGITPVNGADWLLIPQARTQDFLLINSGVI